MALRTTILPPSPALTCSSLSLLLCLLILAFCFFLLLQCKLLDQLPLSFVSFSLKIPQRKDGILPLETESAFLCQSMAAMLRESTAVVVCTCPQAIPLAMITMRKSVHGFPLYSPYGYGAPLGGPKRCWSSAVIEFKMNENHGKTPG